MIVATTTVTAIFGTDDATRQRTVTLQLDERGWVHMRGGPTGYESFEPSTSIAIIRQGWWACMGDGRYEDCVVSGANLERALRDLGVIK